MSISMENQHYQIIQDILGKYPYSFYAFGSRATKHAYKFSGLELCFFEDILEKDLVEMNAELEETGLPFKVDFVDWHACSESFQAIIREDMVIMQASPALLQAEKTIFAHFKYLPKLLECSVDSNAERTIIQAGLHSSMFNIACDTALPEVSTEEKIQQVINGFAGQPFAWWLGPSVKPDNLYHTLLEHGFKRETAEYVMIRSLRDEHPIVQAVSTLEVKLVDNSSILKDFISVMEPYDKAASGFYSQLNPVAISVQEQLFVGYEGAKPVTTGILYLDGANAGVFGLITKEEKRNQGYGSAMMQHLMQYATKHGVASISLSASSESGQRIYESLGFRVIGVLECLEWPGQDGSSWVNDL